MRRKPEKLKIGIDIDGTACDSHPSVLGRINTKYGTDIKKSDITEWNWTRGDISIYKEILDAYEDHAFIESLPPMEGAVAAIRLLSDHFKVAFITTRHISRKTPTENWVKKHFGDYPVEHIVGEGNKNGKELDILVDDNPTNILNFFFTHRKAIIFDQPWNRYLREHDPTNGCVLRCADWPCVVKTVSRLTGVDIHVGGKRPGRPALGRNRRTGKGI